jgi:Integron Cassette Protein Hfx_Cass5
MYISAVVGQPGSNRALGFDDLHTIGVPTVLGNGVRELHGQASFMDSNLMVEDEIAEVGIGHDGRLHVRPTAHSFPHIYRSAKEVGWDPVRGVLISPNPREWSHRDWFRQILAAVSDEYGVRLKVGPGAIWSNVPDELRKQIETDQAQMS